MMTLREAFSVINETSFQNLTPYYLGFKGDIIMKDGKTNTYESKGVYKMLNDNIMEITEIPIDKSIDSYKTLLEELLQENRSKISNHIIQL